MSGSTLCPNCGALLPPNAPAGLCPKCLMRAGLQSEAEVEARPGPDRASATTEGTARDFEPPAAADLADKFPQLEVLELLGYGGMGAVYKARQTNLDRLVALKIIRPEVSHDRTFAERFNREAKTLARLSHQNIVAVYDFGQVAIAADANSLASPLFYFVMEYVEGADLRQLMRTGTLTPEQALTVVPQICDALQFAHDEGVVHRDIKPENILIDKRGRVKIADFGLAKLAAQSAHQVSLTATRQVMGTLRYMAPEQMEDSHGVDHRADIYSLGVVFYEMLTGETPAGHFDPPSKRVEVDVRLDEVVLRALARQPERRYQQASDVKADLESISEVSQCPRSEPEATVEAASETSNRPLPSRDSRSMDSPEAEPQGSDAKNIQGSSQQVSSTLRRAWNQWWAERDRWFTGIVQSLLMLLCLLCQVMFFSLQVSQEAGPERNGLATKRTTIQYGVPGPWFQLVVNPDEKTFHSVRVNIFASSVGIALLGFAFYGALWQIEKAKLRAGKRLNWWDGTPLFMFGIWSVMVVVAVLWGLHPLYSD